MSETERDVEIVKEALEFAWTHLDENGWFVSHGDPIAALFRLVVPSNTAILAPSTQEGVE